MKKLFKSIALLVALLTVVMTFAGCNALDEMKRAHAFYTEEGSILYEDNEYVLFEFSGEMFPVSSSSSQVINVTEPDVPVLLSGMFGDEYRYSDDKVFLVGNTYSGMFDEYYDVYYCRKDVYDEYMDMISNIEYTKYCYVYSDEIDYEMVDLDYVLDEEETAALDMVINETEPIEIPEGASLDYDIYLIVDEASDDLIFRREKCVIMYAERNYFVEVESEDGSESIIYRVPEELEDIFDSIVECYEGAEYEYEYD